GNASGSRSPGSHAGCGRAEPPRPALTGWASIPPFATRPPPAELADEQGIPQALPMVSGARFDWLFGGWNALSLPQKRADAPLTGLSGARGAPLGGANQGKMPS